MHPGILSLKITVLILPLAISSWSFCGNGVLAWWTMAYNNLTEYGPSTIMLLYWLIETGRYVFGAPLLEYRLWDLLQSLLVLLHLQYGRRSGIRAQAG